jgi:hypothetical protein
MAVSAKKCGSGFCKSFEMDLVADAVAGFGKEDSILRRKGLKKPMIIRILKARLEHIVVNIADGEFGFDPWYPQGFELKIGHCSGRILHKGLVNRDGDVSIGFNGSAHQMGLKYLLNKILSQESPFVYFSHHINLE